MPAETIQYDATIYRYAACRYRSCRRRVHGAVDRAKKAPSAKGTLVRFQ